MSLWGTASSSGCVLLIKRSLALSDSRTPYSKSCLSTMTSSIQPPAALNPSLGTPSNEWAEHTTSSLNQPSQGTSIQNVPSDKPAVQSPGVTPGNELPGAFPHRDQGETSTNITESIVDTAKQYLPPSFTNRIETFLGKCPYFWFTTLGPQTVTT